MKKMLLATVLIPAARMRMAITTISSRSTTEVLLL